MVSIVWALIAFSSGLLVYLAAPIIAPALPDHLQLSIARYHSGLSMRAYRQVALVRRTLGTMELLPITTNDEEKLAQVTLDSGMIGDDEKLEFTDPDDRLSRLHRKPFTLVYERVPAAIDAELAELGYWTQQHADQNGLLGADGEKVDPYVTMSDGLRVIDPATILPLVGKAVEPENIKTARQLTKERFRKYGSKVGMAETLGVITGFAVGAGGVGALSYLQNQLIDGQGTSNPSGPISIPTILPPDAPAVGAAYLGDLVVMFA